MRAHLWLLVFVALVVRAQNVGYVVDNANGQVLVIDLATRTVTATIPAGPSASELFILPDNRHAFVSCQASAEVALLDLQNHLRIATIGAGEGPGSLIASPDGRFLYVANETSNDVTVIDAVAGMNIGKIGVGASPVQVNLSPDGRYAYAVNKDETPTGTISVIDTNRNTVVNTLAVGVSPNQFAILPNLTTAYVVNSGSNDLTLIDLAQNVVIGTVPVGQGPVSVTFSSDSRRLYVVNRDSNNISVVDTQQNSVIGTIPTGAQPVAMVVTFDSKFGFVSNQGSSTVSLLDLTLNTKELDIPVESLPFSMMLDPDENFLYVTNLGSASVSVIDVNADRVVSTLAAGGVPVQFAMRNAPTLLELAPRPAAIGGKLTLNGEGFLSSSKVRFTTASPPRVSEPSVTFLDSQGLEVAVPNFQASSAIVDVLNPDGNSSEQITLRPGTASPAIDPGGVVEAAGFAPAPAPISGNGIVAVFGSFPGMPDQTAPSGVFPLPAMLGNTKVSFNGIPAPMFATVSTSAFPQINVVAPVRLMARDKVRVSVTVGSQTSPAEVVNVAPSSPGIFLASGAAIAVHGSDQAQLVTPANPAKRGETLVLYVAGLGDTYPPPIEGEPALIDPLSPATMPVAITVGGVRVDKVWFAGLTPTASGLYQINFDVPQSAPPGNDVEVSVAAGTRISNKAKLAIQ